MVARNTRQIGDKDISQITGSSNRDDNIQMVWRAVERLPASAKEMIILRYYNGLSYEQIGSVLGISKATINGRLTRAKLKIAKYLKRNGFPENRL
jgi:RNA polymerase sigma factor (sigma-70 family)